MKYISILLLLLCSCSTFIKDKEEIKTITNDLIDEAAQQPK